MNVTLIHKLPPGEMKAMAQLISMQKDQIITIMQKDQTITIILNFEEYIRACQAHLSDEQIQSDGSRKPFYQTVGEDALEEIRNKVNMGRS